VAVAVRRHVEKVWPSRPSSASNGRNEIEAVP
jgi:hypothetical protein